MSESKAPILNCGAPPTIVPVVTPGSRDRSISGRVRNVEVRALDTSDWLEPDGRGGWTLRKSMEKQGYLMLEDAYLAENNSQGWADYQRYLADWRNGRTTQPFPLEMLPELVQQRQRGELAPNDRDPWLHPRPKPTTGATDRRPPHTPPRASSPTTGEGEDDSETHLAVPARGDRATATGKARG